MKGYSPVADTRQDHFSSMTMDFKRDIPKLSIPNGCVRVNGNYWHPNPVFVEELAEYLKGRKVLEIFAGNGYLAGLLAQRGIAVTATTRFAGHDSHESGVYYDVQEMEAVEAVHRYGASHEVLLICWPTVTPAALNAVRAWGAGKDVVYIGEVTDYEKGQLGGCATDEFFEQMVFTHRFETYRGDIWESALAGRLRGHPQA